MNKSINEYKEVNANSGECNQDKYWFKVDGKQFHHEFFTMWWKLRKSGFKYRKFMSKDEFKIYKKLADVIFHGNYTSWDEGILIDYHMGKLGKEEPKITGSADYFIRQIELFNATNPHNPKERGAFSAQSGYKYRFYRYVMHLADDFLNFIEKKAA